MRTTADCKSPAILPVSTRAECNDAALDPDSATQKPKRLSLSQLPENAIVDDDETITPPAPRVAAPSAFHSSGRATIEVHGPRQPQRVVGFDIPENSDTDPKIPRSRSSTKAINETPSLPRERLAAVWQGWREEPFRAFSLAELSAGIGQKPLTESEAQLSVRSPGSGPQQGNSGERQPASSLMKQAESGCSTTEGWVSHLASLSWKWLAAPKHSHLLDNYPAPEPFKIQWRRPNVAVTVNQAQPPPKWNDLLMPRCREGL
ncbi:hypothetical protein MCOR19_011659 [Pyricularia oryzae]|nr:hypothetical protein MCOR19_011659 [Pyricularia oryzae]KAI6415593.1 hypothetical protein MCOR20_001419 [Pyricularia oryzae]KAI6463768.1 hypothetical protein MCOR18_010630 [Pyricularia oryzae]